MKHATTLALVSVLGLAPATVLIAASTTPAVAAEETTSEGTVKSVDAKAGSFVLTVGGKDVTVRTDKDTKFRRDGKDSKMEDVVKVGEKLKVTHKDGLAKKTEVVAKAPDKPAAPKTPDKPKAPPTAPPTK